MGQMVKRTPSEELAAIFDERAQAIAKALPPNCGLTPARFAQFAIQASKTDQLRGCSPMSIYEAALESASLGLTIGGSLAHGYLVPYKGQAQFQLGYRGMVELLRRSGAVTQCEVRAVFDGDEFDYSYGLSPRLDHKPIAEPTPQGLTHAYVIVRFKDGTAQFDVMTRGEILAIMARSKASGSGPWVTDPIEMAKKCPVRRIAKVLPMSQELNDALSRDDERTIDLTAKVIEIPKTFAPPRNPARLATTEEPGDAPMTNDDEIPFEQSIQSSPIDDFVLKFAAARTPEDIKKIGADIAEVGLSKNPQLVSAYKAAVARIKESAGAAQ